MGVNVKVLGFDDSDGSCQSAEQFTEALTGCINYLMQEAKAMEFNNTAHLLDVALHVVKEDFDNASK